MPSAITRKRRKAEAMPPSLEEQEAETRNDEQQRRFKKVVSQNSGWPAVVTILLLFFAFQAGLRHPVTWGILSFGGVFGLLLWLHSSHKLFGDVAYPTAFVMAFFISVAVALTISLLLFMITRGYTGNHPSTTNGGTAAA